MTFWVTCFTHIWPINHLASHLTPGSLVRASTHGWDSTDISHTLNRVPTSGYTLPSHRHLGNHPEDWFPSITSRIVTHTSPCLQSQQHDGTTAEEPYHILCQTTRAGLYLPRTLPPSAMHYSCMLFTRNIFLIWCHTWHKAHMPKTPWMLFPCNIVFCLWKLQCNFKLSVSSLCWTAS